MNIERITTHLSKGSGQGTAMLSRQGKATISNFLCFSWDELNAKRIKENKEAAAFAELQLAIEQGAPAIMKELLRKAGKRRPHTKSSYGVSLVHKRDKREHGRE